MVPSFFSSPFWRDVSRALESAPQFLPGVGPQWVHDANVARRLLEDRLRCISEACNRADHETQRELRKMLAGLEIESVLYGLLETLKEAVLIVGGSVGVGSLAGMGVGSFFGGIGALPGAAVGAALGAQVATWILAALGLAALAEFFVEGLPRILDHYQRGFSVAWQAGRDEVTERNPYASMHQSSQINAASMHIASGHVEVVLLLLGAVVSYLTRGRGSMQALAQQASGGRLGPKFAQWMVKHEEALRKHPALQLRQRRATGAAGDGGGSPPAPPPPRRDGREPGGPRKMPRKAVRCFSTKNLTESKIDEFDKQLGGQEAGVNRMTVEEYLMGRDTFKNRDVTRDSKVASEAREKHRRRLTRDLAETLLSKLDDSDEAWAEARRLADDKMTTLAALHYPDMAAAGKDLIAAFGDSKVNSRIGALWRAGNWSRLDELDEAAKAVPIAERGATLMNAKLDRCQ